MARKTNNIKANNKHFVDQIADNNRTKLEMAHTSLKRLTLSQKAPSSERDLCRSPLASLLKSNTSIVQRSTFISFPHLPAEIRIKIWEVSWSL